MRESLPDNMATSAEPGEGLGVVDDIDQAIGELLDEQQALKGEHSQTAKRILNLNLPDAIKHTEPQWRDHALVGDSQTFPNFFKHEAPADKESALSMSGKVHWQELAEGQEQIIPALNTIEGLELEISVRTR